MNDFMEDQEKLYDLLVLNKKEFLDSYSYLTEDEYDNTIFRIKNLIKSTIGRNERTKKRRSKDVEKSRQGYLDYYYNNRDKINAKRNKMGSIQRLANIDGIKNKAERKIIIEYVELHEQEIREYKKKIQEEKEKIANIIYQRNYKKMKEIKSNGKSNGK